MCLTCGGKPHFEGIFPNVFYERRGRDSAFPWEMMEKGSKWNAYIFIVVLIATKAEDKTTGSMMQSFELISWYFILFRKQIPIVGFFYQE